MVFCFVLIEAKVLFLIDQAGLKLINLLPQLSKCGVAGLHVTEILTAQIRWKWSGRQCQVFEKGEKL